MTTKVSIQVFAGEGLYNEKPLAEQELEFKSPVYPGNALIRFLESTLAQLGDTVVKPAPEEAL